jgi:aryl-alcohol dehydrogenase-like predicted oxidoreductase
MMRRLGRSGLSVSPLTLGTDGAKRLSPADLRNLFARALDAGINAVEIDAADANVAEALAVTIRSRGGQSAPHIFCRIAPLIPLSLPAPHFLADQVYPGSSIRAQVDALLARLEIGRLALVHLPIWSPEWLEEGDWLPTLQQLRQEGKIADFGVATFDHDADAALGAVASGAIGSVQLMYNLFDPHPARSLLPLCARQDVAVLARAPLYHGGLVIDSPTMRGEQGWGNWRDAHFYPAHRAETADRAARIALDLNEGEGSLAEIALRFCLSPEAVSSVVVGMRTLDHIAANLAAVAKGSLDPARAAALAARHAWLC